MAFVDPQNQPPHIQLQPLRDEQRNRYYLAFEEGSRATRLSWFYLLILTAITLSAASILFEISYDFTDFYALTLFAIVAVSGTALLFLLYTLASTHLWSSSQRIELRVADIDVGAPSSAQAQFYRGQVAKLQRRISGIRLAAHVVVIALAVLGVGLLAPWILLEFGIDAPYITYNPETAAAPPPNAPPPPPPPPPPPSPY